MQNTGSNRQPSAPSTMEIADLGALIQDNENALSSFIQDINKDKRIRCQQIHGKSLQDIAFPNDSNVVLLYSIIKVE